MVDCILSSKTLGQNTFLKVHFGKQHVKFQIQLISQSLDILTSKELNCANNNLLHFHVFRHINDGDDNHCENFLSKMFTHTDQNFMHQ